MKSSAFRWIGMAALIWSVSNGCSQEEPVAPTAESQEAPQFNSDQPSLAQYGDWSATGKAVVEARSYLAANPKAKDASTVAEKAARATLDAALTAALTGDESALDALQLAVGDSGKIGAAGSAVVELMTDRLAISNRENILRLSKALSEEGAERMKMLMALSKESEGLESRAIALLMKDLQPTLKRYQETSILELDPMVVDEVVKKALELTLTEVSNGDPLKGTLQEAEKAFQMARNIRISFPLPGDGESPDTGKLAESGALGPLWSAAPLSTMVVGPTGVRIAHRPTIRVRDGKKVVPAENRVLDGAPFLTKEQWMDPGKEETPDQPAVPSGIQTLAGEIGTAAEEGESLAEDMVGVTQPSEDKGAQLFIQVEKEAGADVLVPATKAAEEAGVDFIRWVTGPNPRDYVVAGVASATERTDVPPTLFERPILVVVKEGEVDFYPPSRRKTESGEKEESVEKPLPKELVKWYSGTRLFKYTLKGNAPEQIQSALAGLGAEYGAGPHVRVEANKGISAAQATDVLAAVAQTPGKSLAMNEFVQGIVCGEEADACPAVLPIAFTGMGIPKARNLTNEPVKKAAPVAKPAPPKAAPASPKYCNKGDIQKVMKAKKGKFKFCYERQLQMYPDLRGKVTVQFEIPAGQKKVNKVRIANSELKNEKVHGCLKKAIRKLNFTPPDGGACAVSWPFVFK